MIVEFFLDPLFVLVNGFFSLLPDFSWSSDSAFFQGILGFIKMAGYLLPWDTVSLIFGVVVSLTLLRILVSFVKTIWDLLPLV